MEPSEQNIEESKEKLVRDTNLPDCLQKTKAIEKVEGNDSINKKGIASIKFYFYFPKSVICFAEVYIFFPGDKPPGSKMASVNDQCWSIIAPINIQKPKVFTYSYTLLAKKYTYHTAEFRRKGADILQSLMVFDAPHDIYPEEQQNLQANMLRNVEKNPLIFYFQSLFESPEIWLYTEMRNFRLFFTRYYK